MRKIISTLLVLAYIFVKADTIPQSVMQSVYNEVRTPYKYGLVLAPTDNFHKFDCPTLFRDGEKWLMTYVCYDGKDGTDGRGYETWLAASDDLLHWTTLGRVLSLPVHEENGASKTRKESWDHNQRGGFPALIDWTWGGSYAISTYKKSYWMTYIGGHGTGYEAVREPLNIGLASNKGPLFFTAPDGLPTGAREWKTSAKPLLSYNDKDAQWWEKLTQYKSTIYDDPDKTLGRRFVMFYNAGGINPANNLKAERIGIALSDNLKKWERYSGNPVYTHEAPGIITGDAQIVKMFPAQFSPSSGESREEALYVMFYFSAYNPERKYNAYNTFAVSRDLIHWQDWTGDDLIAPSKPYDEMFAHKSCVVKHDGVVYHFYCAVNNAQQRGIAVATSRKMGRSAVHFPEPEPVGKRRLTSLNDGWTGFVCGDSIATTITLPHNFDDYYGYRQLRHGNLHGSAFYNRMFACEKKGGKRYFLQFEGVGTYATVTLNGHEYPRELVGRTVWTLDITDALRSGDNQLSVRVDHPAMQTESPWVCGGCSSEYGFSEGSQPFGIFRPVALVETDETRIEPFGVHIWANESCDSVFIDTEIKNYSTSPQVVELVNKLAEKSGKAVFRLSRELRLGPGETRTVRQSATIANAHCWSLDDPYLYTLTTMLKQPSHYDGDANQMGEPAYVTTDDVRTPFGIRSISWPRSVGRVANATDNRFYLNGQPVFINGTCEYEHLLGASHAFSHEQIAARIKMIRKGGFNAFREAHQPHNLYYQQLLDEQGLLFWSQFSAHIWYDTPQFRDNFKRLLTRWVKERRNSPSVILWGLQNESVLPRDFAEECTALIRSLDPTTPKQRLVTTCNGGEGTDWNVIQNWSGTYGGNPDAYAEELSRPEQLLNGEYGAWRTLDLHGPDKYSEESFTALLDKKARLAWQAFSAAGGFPTDIPTGGVGGRCADHIGLDVDGKSADHTGLDVDGKSADHTGLGVCGHFQWLFVSHDNPGRVQPDGALRRIDKIGPINHKGLLTIWEEPINRPTPNRLSPSSSLIGRGGDTSKAECSHNAHKDKGLQGNCSPPYKGGVGGESFYRINCGGDAYTDSHGNLWQADDSLLSHSWGQDFEGVHPYQASQRHLTVPIRGTEDPELFQFFRYGRHRLWYDLPVPTTTPDGSPVCEYLVTLYFVEPWHGKDDDSESADYEGLRIFDVAINDSLVIDDLDPWAEAGYATAFSRTVTARAKNGRLHISFPEVKVGQAVICAIEVSEKRRMKNEALDLWSLATEGTQEFATADPSTGGVAVANSSLFTLHSSLPWHSLDTDTIAKLPKDELPQDTDARPATVYEPQKPQEARKAQQLQSSQTTTFLITPGLGQEYALRFRYKNTTGQPVTARLRLTDSKNTVLVDREISFPPTPDKFKMLSTTTGTQINAGSYRLTIEADGLTFKNLEIQ